MIAMSDHDRTTQRDARCEFLDLVGDAIISIDENGHILLFNREAERTFGYEASEVVGRPVEVLLPERYRGVHADQVRGYATGLNMESRLMGHRREVIGLRRNGKEFPVEATLSHRALDGTAVMTVCVRDVSERRHLEEEKQAHSLALEQSESRMKLALKGGQMGAWEWDLGSGALLMDACARDLWGLPAAGALDVAAAFERIQREDLWGVHRAVRRAMEGDGDYGHEFRIIRRGGKTVWVAGRAIVARNAAGTPERLIGVTFNVTDRHEKDEQRRLLLGEMDHRVKNMMALVNSVVSMTARNATSVEAFTKALEGRLAALAAANDALLKTGWRSVGLREQLLSELGLYEDPGGVRLRLGGPEISLPPQLALSLRLVFHELATNAVKYGALGSPTGRLNVEWTMEETAASGHLLVIEWRESGGPPVAPPDRKGFGTTLITRSLAAHNGAQVDLQYDVKGVCCRLALPWQAPEPPSAEGFGGGMSRHREKARPSLTKRARSEHAPRPPPV